MNFTRAKWTLLLVLLPGLLRAQQVTYVQQRTADGILEGVVSADGKVRTFKGIPFAAPPIGPLRWKPPQPVQPWTGVRKAVEYGPRPMQWHLWDDMIFRDAGPSEDCLYLNLWMPAKPESAKLPVMVWIYGGGFIGGSTSEARQDGGNLCQKGVVVVSMNYRLGVLGFFAHPELTRESGHNASGNYALLDQVAALEWVKRNIAAFGGDPDNVTIFGESAGSVSVSALMASPLAQGLFRRAIGESGALFAAGGRIKSLAEAEEVGVKFSETAFGTSSLEALRAKPAQELLDAAIKVSWETFGPDADGYFLPAEREAVYAAGRQSHVPLLAGWTRDEDSYREFLGDDQPTVENYVARVRTRFGDNADAFLKLYPATTVAEVKRSAQDFAGDHSIAHATWEWIEAQLKTGGSPVYRYEFDETLPLPANAPPGTEASAPHASDIVFVFHVLSARNLPWRPADWEVSELMATYWTNFAKNGDPNGPGLPHWPQYNRQDGYQVMHLDAHSIATPDSHRARYEFLESSKPGD